MPFLCCCPIPYWWVRWNGSHLGIEKMIAELEKADSSGIVIKRRHAVRSVLSLPILNLHAFHCSRNKSRGRGQTHYNEFVTELGDIQLPEVTDSSEDEEITLRWTEVCWRCSRTCKVRSLNGKQAASTGWKSASAIERGKVTYRTKKKANTGGEPQSEAPQHRLELSISTYEKLIIRSSSAHCP